MKKLLELLLIEYDKEFADRKFMFAVDINILVPLCPIAYTIDIAEGTKEGELGELGEYLDNNLPEFTYSFSGSIAKDKANALYSFGLDDKGHADRRAWVVTHINKY